MIIDSKHEIKLYEKESIDLPHFIRDKFPKIKFVYQPENIQDMQWLFSISKKEKLPIIPRGAATSGMGGITPLRKSVMVDLTNLKNILDFDEKEKIIYFEAGLRWWELRNFLNQYSFDVFTCPTSLFSTVGGWLATGGYGINSYKYGHVSNHVESIEALTPDKTMKIERKDQRFKHFIGTEGQMGIISKIKLKVRKKYSSKVYLVFFESASGAVEFLFRVLSSPKINPSHISYFDKHRLTHKNLLLNGKVSFPLMESVLVVFEDDTKEEIFLDIVEKKKGVIAEDYLTAFLWNERFFPFSLKRFHPSILGCEIILPIENLPRYITHMTQFSENYGISLSTEATLINDEEAVVFTVFPSDPKKVIFLFHLFLSYSLAHVAMCSGGKPYGIGIWNLPFLKKKYSAQEIKEYRSFKKEVDSLNLLNSSKSFSRNGLITSLLKLGYFLSTPFSNAYSPLKLFFKNNNSSHKKVKKTIPETEACANCGACTVVCPAYLAEKNEVVTAKGKLFLMRQMKRGSALPRNLAEKIFLCLHCHLCENVCQSKLTLLPVWDKLESEIEEKYGRPSERIEKFIEKMESDPEYTKLLESLNISPNNRKEIPNV